jgi:HlyD family secretion protein
MRGWPASLGARLIVGAALVAVTAAGVYWRTRRDDPVAPTATVTRGDFVEVIEARGEIRPIRSVFVSAPYQAGELLILELTPTGTAVRKGDPVVKFDAVNLRRQLQEKQSELRQARAEAAEAVERAKIQEQADAAAVWRAENDVQRARLDIGDPTVLSAMEVERTRLAVADAEQRLAEARVKLEAGRQTAAADQRTRQRKTEKIAADLAYLERAVEVLEVAAPADGTVSVMINSRSRSMTGGSPQEFRPGDRTYAGATILELPDLSEVHLLSRIEESDRGLLKTGQTATIQLDAIPGREYQATLDEISLLARPDYTSWPPTKNFEIRLTLTNPDERIRPGMSAAARIAVGRLPDMLLVPAEAVFTAHGRTVVYRQEGGEFVEVPIDIIRRGRDQMAVKGLTEGDRLALTPPDAAEDGPEA